MSDPVLYEKDDAGIVTLTLNRPELRNPISDEDVLEAMHAALDRLGRDEKVRVAILTGAGSAFSSGGNLKKMGSEGGLNDPLPARTRLNYRRGIQKLPLAFEALEVPVIAAVNGPAIGAGCDLTLMCDLRVASEEARFAESFVKVGIVPGDGGAWLLPRVVGFSKACEMALTGDPVDAQEAKAIGLVSAVVSRAELLPTARKLALRIAANPEGPEPPLKPGVIWPKIPDDGHARTSFQHHHSEGQPPNQHSYSKRRPMTASRARSAERTLP